MRARNQSERAQAGQISQEQARRLLKAAEEVAKYYRKGYQRRSAAVLDAMMYLNEAIEEIRLGE